MHTEVLGWEEEWLGMPAFYPPTRDTQLRNSYDISDEIVASLFAKTTTPPRYPVYIISKGRWESRKTVTSLDALGIAYRIVVEPQERAEYARYIPESRILALPFGNLGHGSIPARNWVFEHAIAEGHRRHWILDDNIVGFGTQKYGRRIRTNSGDFFRLCEDFTDRYENVAMAGIRYRFHHNYILTPYLLNTRIYSCILMNNEIPHRWRGRYNEDTDLSIRVLKDKYRTILFTWCYCDKMATMKLKGGNTDELYEGDGRTAMAESLQQQHPDIVTIVDKWGRKQHSVNFNRFKNNGLQRIHERMVI